MRVALALFVDAFVNTLRRKLNADIHADNIKAFCPECQSGLWFNRLSVSAFSSEKAFEKETYCKAHITRLYNEPS